MLYPDALNFIPQTFKDRAATQGSGALVASHFERSVHAGVTRAARGGCESTAGQDAYSERVVDLGASRPVPLLLAAVVIGLEALAALAFGGVALTQIPISRAGVAFWMLGYGVLLLALARGVFLGRRWSRAPSVATQLILLPLAFSFRGQPTTWVAGIIAVAAVAALVGMLHPHSTEVFVGPPTQPPDPAR